MLVRSVGVEEELLLVDPGSGRALALSAAVLRDARESGGAALTSELTRQQIETNTRPCTSLEELGHEVRRWRRVAAEAAESRGAAVAALATSPLPVDPSITASPRYRRMVERFALTAAEQLTCGCHVHVQIESETLLDEGMVYFDARLSREHPTVEVRVADVCLLADDTVLLAALTRALVDTAARSWQAGGPAEPVRTELLRLADWRAGRSGLEGELLTLAGRPAPAARVIRALIDHVRPALAERGELEIVEDLASAVLDRGPGAAAQRRIYGEHGQLTDVVSYAVKATLS